MKINLLILLIVLVMTLYFTLIVAGKHMFSFVFTKGWGSAEKACCNQINFMMLKICERAVAGLLICGSKILQCNVQLILEGVL